MPDNDDSQLDSVLAAYAAVEPPSGAETRWREGLRRGRPAPERFLGLSARSWAAACGVSILTLLLSTSAFLLRTRKTLPQPPAVVAAPVEVPQPADSSGSPPTPEERLLIRLTETNPPVLAAMFKDSLKKGATP